MGLNAVPTSRNTKAVDLIVHNPQNGKAVGVQVKTKHQERTDPNNDVYIVSSGTYSQVHKKTFTNPFVFVYVPKNGILSTRCFVVPPKDVTKLLVEQWEWYRDHGKHRKPLEEIAKTKTPLDIYVRQLLKYEDHWENLW